MYKQFSQIHKNMNIELFGSIIHQYNDFQCVDTFIDFITQIQLNSINDPNYNDIRSLIDIIYKISINEITSITISNYTNDLSADDTFRVISIFLDVLIITNNSNITSVVVSDRPMPEMTSNVNYITALFIKLLSNNHNISYLDLSYVSPSIIFDIKDLFKISSINTLIFRHVFKPTTNHKLLFQELCWELRLATNISALDFSYNDLDIYHFDALFCITRMIEFNSYVVHINVVSNGFDHWSMNKIMDTIENNRRKRYSFLRKLLELL